MDYFKNRDERRRHAISWTQKMAETYPDKIASSVGNTRLYDDSYEFSLEKRYDATPMLVEEADSVTALFRHFDNAAVLNFASYRNAGGMFYDGSSAQEESLCHESFLYNVLREERDYYATNALDMNRGMYRNRALYSPDILFIRGEHTIKADVLTCACPNHRHVTRKQATEEYNLEHLKSRIEFVLNILAEEKKDIIILGAFGCGVFEQNPETVASIFNELIANKFNGMFKMAVFAIPDEKSENFIAFRNVIAPNAGKVYKKGK